MNKQTEAIRVERYEERKKRKENVIYEVNNVITGMHRAIDDPSEMRTMLN
jgi:hypothetical protein